MNFIISLNIKGLGAGHKCLALKDCFRSVCPKIIPIQETMHASPVTISYFRKMFPYWYISAVEANGLSGGLAVLWDPYWIKAKTYSCLAGIMISAHMRGLNCPINILNVYAPYRNRLFFLENLFASEIFDIEYLMIAGDLNFTLNMEEIWGVSKKKDPLAEKIKIELLVRRNYIDIRPSHMLPTWENGRSGDAYIAKRLDRFFLHANLIDKMGMPFSSIEHFFISDHRPISLGWKQKGFRKGYSFKFNRTALDDPAFNNYIKNAWQEMMSSCPTPFLMTFRDKMDHMRRAVKYWQIKKRQSNRRELRSIQIELDHA